MRPAPNILELTGRSSASRRLPPGRVASAKPYAGCYTKRQRLRPCAYEGAPSSPRARAIRMPCPRNPVSTAGIVIIKGSVLYPLPYLNSWLFFPAVLPVVRYAHIPQALACVFWPAYDVASSSTLLIIFNLSSCINLRLSSSYFFLLHKNSGLGYPSLIVLSRSTSNIL